VGEEVVVGEVCDGRGRVTGTQCEEKNIYGMIRMNEGQGNKGQIIVMIDI